MIEVLKTPWGVQDRKDAKKLIIREGAIVFKKVSFAYDKKKLFDNLSFSIKS